MLFLYHFFQFMKVQWCFGKLYSLSVMSANDVNLEEEKIIILKHILIFGALTKLRGVSPHFLHLR